MKTLLVTGGSGFIGTNFIHHIFSTRTDMRIVNLDALTYAGNVDSLSDIYQDCRYRFIWGNICDFELVRKLLNEYQPSAIVHFAAESHVDRSIDHPVAFLQSNVMGTFNLLEATRHWWRAASPDQRRNFRFLHVSTDEVYGSLGAGGYFTEESAYAPNSPYSASKAAADHFVRAYHHTYGLPVLITNCSNNYGPYQYPEKLIPLMIMNALLGKELPIYGDGMQIRDWLYVMDHCRAILTILEQGSPGERFIIGGHNEMKNIEIVQLLCSMLDELQPRDDGRSYQKQMVFVTDRPGHDRRYAVDATKICVELGWRPQETFPSGIRKTVEWYLQNLPWCEQVTARDRK